MCESTCSLRNFPYGLSTFYIHMLHLQHLEPKDGSSTGITPNTTVLLQPHGETNPKSQQNPEESGRKCVLLMPISFTLHRLLRKHSWEWQGALWHGVMERNPPVPGRTAWTRGTACFSPFHRVTVLRQWGPACLEELFPAGGQRQGDGWRGPPCLEESWLLGNLAGKGMILHRTLSFSMGLCGCTMPYISWKLFPSSCQELGEFMTPKRH